MSSVRKCKVQDIKSDYFVNLLMIDVMIKSIICPLHWNFTYILDENYLVPGVSESLCIFLSVWKFIQIL